MAPLRLRDSVLTNLRGGEQTQPETWQTDTQPPPPPLPEPPAPKNEYWPQPTPSIPGFLRNILAPPPLPTPTLDPFRPRDVDPALDFLDNLLRSFDTEAASRTSVGPTGSTLTPSEYGAYGQVADTRNFIADLFSKAVSWPQQEQQPWQTKVWAPTEISQKITRMLLEAPLDEGAYSITGGFGQTGGPYPSSGHIGVDFGTGGKSVPIYAPMRGEVVESGYSDGYGNYVKLRHPDGTMTLYAHMASPSPWQVGDAVADRAVLGNTGETGHAFGIHLHMEAYDASGNRIDPMGWLGREVELHPDGLPYMPTSPSETTDVDYTYPMPRNWGDAPEVGSAGDGTWTKDDAINAIRYWSQQYGYSPEFTQFALAVAYGESGWNPYAVGDNGMSFGIWQFYTGGGRGDGHRIEDLYNPYFTSEINLPILYKVFQQYGGESGWRSNAANVLKNGWKYGQGSIWPTDAQITAALGAIGELGDAPATTPSDSTQTVSTPSTSQVPLLGDIFGGRQDPAAMFLQQLFGDGGFGTADPAQLFLQKLMSGDMQFGPDPASAFLRSLFGNSA